jgi:hypothetical protein
MDNLKQRKEINVDPFQSKLFLYLNRFCLIFQIMTQFDFPNQKKKKIFIFCF